MSAKPDSTQKRYSERLADIASALRNETGDETMLREVHAAMQVLLSEDGASEREVRATLRQQFEKGEIRKESFELVQNLIDRVTSDAATDPSAEFSDDSMATTTVIATHAAETATENRTLQVGSVLRDRFMLQEKIAGGSMGTVYKALDRRLAEADSEDHSVAIKVLSPRLSRDVNALRALQQEAVKTRCLLHPNIVRFIDLDRDDDLYFMVMEWLEGRTLADILDRSPSKAIDIDRAFHIVRQLGLALEYAHQRGVVHADIKPANIILTPDDDVKLFDFGVARIRQKESKSKPEFDPGVLKAMTPAYSSMQVLTGEDPVPADDVFSLGALTYRLIAGYRVFGPRNAAEAAESGMEPQRPDGLSDPQWQALRKALSFSRVTRFSSPRDFVAALTSNTNGEETRTETAVAVDVTSRRSPWRFVAIALIFTAGVATVIETDLLDRLRLAAGERLSDAPAAVPAGDSAAAVQEPVVEAAAGEKLADGAAAEPVQGPAADTGAEPVPEPPADESEDRVTPNSQTDAAVGAAVDEELPAGPGFADLPPPNALIDITETDSEAPEVSFTLVEDGSPLIVDFLRSEQLDEPLELRVTEQSFSGNRSPWETGQYAVSNNGVVAFLPGQSRSRTTIGMSSDPVREPDRSVRLVLRDPAGEGAPFAKIDIDLQDDDQRAFEDSLAPNTVAFAVSQVSVRERDSAVQIDLIRYKPDATELEVNYTIRDVTATEGDDYVDPGGRTVFFAPGQRSARILVPLVQDASRENDEAFMLELTGDAVESENNTYRRIAVMIRDDDS